MGAMERLMGGDVGIRLARIGEGLSKVMLELRLMGRSELHKILGGYCEQEIG